MNQNQNQNETVQIMDLDQFVKILVGWHTNKVAVLQHMLSIPEGSEMTTGDGRSVTLEGDLYTGFLAGIELSLMELGILPFAVETEPMEAANEAPAVTAEEPATPVPAAHG